MIDFQEALAQTEKVRDTRCIVGKVVSELEQREQVEAALASTLPHSHLARALSLMTGRKIDQNQIGKHRRDGCGCGS